MSMSLFKNRKQKHKTKMQNENTTKNKQNNFTTIKPTHHVFVQHSFAAPFLQGNVAQCPHAHEHHIGGFRRSTAIFHFRASAAGTGTGGFPSFSFQIGIRCTKQNIKHEQSQKHRINIDKRAISSFAPKTKQ
jgi:hypothetical protein